MSTSCSSTSVESTHSASITVRSVFSCVASRKREAAGPRDEASRSPSGPNPLGENITLSSPPLEPRRLLLSVMRQKVGKERSQGVFAPLAIPPDWAANHQQRKFGLAPTPLEVMQNPGWSAQRHPRASATLWAIGVTADCGTSATADTAGRQPLRVPMPTIWTSTPPGPVRSTATTMRAVFSCAASRNTQRVSYWGFLSRI